MIYKNALEMIGNTRMVRINDMLEKEGVNIFAKLEGDNPGGSIKDRIAYRMINEAIDKGELKEGMTIIEATSGNTGIALSMIGTVLGYDVEIVMSDAVSVERRKVIQAYGAKITLTEGKYGTDGAIKKARQLVRNNPGKYFYPDQYSNEDNISAHLKTTAEEIWKQTEGKITHCVSAVGTSGTIMGLSRFLKEKNPDIRIVCAHPTKGHYIQGLKNMEEAVVPAIYDESMIDVQIMVESEVAFDTARKLAKKEGLLVGMSSGAAMYAALQVGQLVDKANIAVIFPDRGEKYLSTALFEDN